METQLLLFGGQMLQSPCTIAQATSALVKCVRLRHTEAAIYWYNHVARCFPDQSFRLIRRMFIIAAEDNVEVPVQMLAYDWFKKAFGKADPDFVTGAACHLIATICSTRNWWQDPGGQAYILHWRLTEKWCKDQKFPPGETPGYWVECMKTALKEDNLEAAMRAHMRMCETGANRGEYAQLLVEEATRRRNLKARLVAQAHLTNAKVLSNFDENWLGQALWRVMGQTLGSGEYQEPDADWLHQQIVQSIAELNEGPRVPPSWTQDGIHCSGKDTRFAGMLPSMVGCCNMFNRHGKLDPTQEWDNTSRSTQELYKHVHG